MNPSPLRYPGGKYKLYKYVSELVKENKHCCAKIDTAGLRSQFNLWGEFSVGN